MFLKVSFFRPWHASRLQAKEAKDSMIKNAILAHGGNKGDGSWDDCPHEQPVQLLLIRICGFNIHGTTSPSQIDSGWNPPEN